MKNKKIKVGANQSEICLFSKSRRPNVFLELLFKVGVNQSEFRLVRLRSRNYVFLELLFKVGANQSENFYNLALEASFSDSILLKNEARWMRKACSAPSGDHLKEMHEKESKGWAWNMRSLSILSCASPQNNLSHSD